MSCLFFSSFSPLHFPFLVPHPPPFFPPPPLPPTRYLDLKSLFADLSLMVNNCLLYNPPGTSVRLAGEQLGKMVKEKHKAYKKNKLFNKDKFAK